MAGATYLGPRKKTTESRRTLREEEQILHDLDPPHITIDQRR
jgi:hypothetical protein